MEMHTREVPPLWRSPSGIAFMVAVAVGGFFLWTEHRAHLFGVLPFLVPVLGFLYVRPALAEERDSAREFGNAWLACAAVTPRFVPSWRGAQHQPA